MGGPLARECRFGRRPRQWHHRQGSAVLGVPAARPFDRARGARSVRSLDLQPRGCLRFFQEAPGARLSPLPRQAGPANAAAAFADLHRPAADARGEIDAFLAGQYLARAFARVVVNSTSWRRPH